MASFSLAWASPFPSFHPFHRGGTNVSVKAHCPFALFYHSRSFRYRGPSSPWYLFTTAITTVGITRGEEVTRTLIAPAIGITSVSVLGVEGGETTFALYQTADDGATTFIQTMVADATDIADAFPAPSFVCNFHSTATGKMQCIEADGTSTAVISVNVQTLLYAVNDVAPTAPSSSLHVQPTNTLDPSAATEESSVPTSSTNPATGEGYVRTTFYLALTPSHNVFPSSPNASQTSSAPFTTPSSAAPPAFVATTYNKMSIVLGLVAALAL
ncbi:hypothetical protein B0H16DRAFT_1551108 [Mycena metata]|uniref:Uncharacterized protein n=1 Tax=Mycena metata TaxID=1033252 RepID=A0AAD7IUL4_9AGAR|nr:hypothetical protein B0H16DRAFT_1551108 [Mycena metata]